MADDMLRRLQEFLQHNSSLIGAGALTLAGVTAASLFLSSDPKPMTPPIDLNNQAILLDGKDRVRTSAFLKSDPQTLLTYLYDDVKTTYEAFLRGLRVSKNGRCLGTRTGAGQPYSWLTYQQVLDKAHSVGSGLVSRGLVASNSTFVGIYSANCVEWAVSDLGCQMFSMVPVPLYDTLGPDSCRYVINQTELCTVICDNAKNAMNLMTISKDIPTLKTIVFIGQQLPEELKQAAVDKKVDVLLFSDLEAFGRKNKQEPVPPKPEDLATICYTSGTTGYPKGVMLTHSNVTIMLSSILYHIKAIIIHPDDVHLSYLPLAHMFERCVHVLIFMMGAKIGYFSGDVRKLLEDLVELKPTVLATVPRVLNRVFDKVQAGTSNSWFKSNLLSFALRNKLREVKRGVVRKNSIWDKLVFWRVQNMFGGRVRLIITGSAPLSTSVLNFTRCAFGCVVLEGFGQTEATAGCLFNVPGETDSGSVGGPLTCNQIKLVDVPEMEYYAKEDVGEVCCKGGNVMRGYFKNPEKTAEVLGEDGWLHTGDIGRWTPNGTMQIIDRKKNIFKLAQGEYVAVERIESVYTQSPFVAQCFVDGDSFKTCVMAVVVPDEDVVKDFAQNNGLPTDFAEFCQSEKAKDVILNSMLEIGKKNQLRGFEQAKDIFLQHELFSLKNDLLTPSMKNKRAALRKRFKEIIDGLYRKHNV